MRPDDEETSMGSGLVAVLGSSSSLTAASRSAKVLTGAAAGVGSNFAGSCLAASGFPCSAGFAAGSLVAGSVAGVDVSLLGLPVRRSCASCLILAPASDGGGGLVEAALGAVAVAAVAGVVASDEAGVVAVAGVVVAVAEAVAGAAAFGLDATEAKSMTLPSLSYNSKQTRRKRQNCT